MNQIKTRFSMLQSTFLVTLILLVIQYVLGMLINLFVQFPSVFPDGNAWGWSFTHTFVTPTHILLGTLLLVIALVALVMSIRTQHVTEFLVGVCGLAMIIYAWLSGASFLSNGQQNSASFQMALGFIGAAIAYSIGLFITRPTQKNSKKSAQEQETLLTAQ